MAHRRFPRPTTHRNGANLMSTFADQSRTFLQRKFIHSQWESDYLNSDMDRFYDLAFDDILNRLKPTSDSTILDAGCGYCYHTVRLARGGSRITAIDFSEAALDEGQKTIERANIQNQVSLQKADLTALPFADASFDFIVSWGVLMHIPQMEMALFELSRVLKPGGTLVLSENNMKSLDVSIRERAIYLLKKAIGRQSAQMKRTTRGIEMWEAKDSGGLMVRKTDMDFLEHYLASIGLKQIAKTPGQFTEVYTNMPMRFLKRIVYAINNFYFRNGMSANFAVGNIIYFRKKSRS
jgi:ubiquinone/menaquinone biosynthesis C-methylase UbiE